jgi:acetyltransferase-like isoleucine patch superfamily enzyme
MKPWHVEVFGWPIELGDYANVIAASDKKVRLTVWSNIEQEGKIKIGNCCLICPGVRISAATEITIGDSCMMAHGTYITDSDWHGIYDRSLSIGQSTPVKIGNNVWLGDSVIVGKGVHIGDNSIIGAGSVVVKDIPPNVIAAGNPAIIVKTLDPDQHIKTRVEWFADVRKLAAEFDEIDRGLLKDNTFLGWIRSIIFPRRGD